MGTRLLSDEDRRRYGDAIRRHTVPTRAPDRARVPAPLPTVLCGGQLGDDPRPYYHGTTQYLPDLDGPTPAGETDSVVLTELNGAALLPGRYYRAVLSADVEGVPLYWTEANALVSEDAEPGSADDGTVPAFDSEGKLTPTPLYVSNFPQYSQPATQFNQFNTGQIGSNKPVGQFTIAYDQNGNVVLRRAMWRSLDDRRGVTETLTLDATTREPVKVVQQYAVVPSGPPLQFTIEPNATTGFPQHTADNGRGASVSYQTLADGSMRVLLTNTTIAVQNADGTVTACGCCDCESGGGAPAPTVGTTAATGSDQAGAAPLVYQQTLVTASAPSVGVVLTAGSFESFVIANDSATNTVKVYPMSGSQLQVGVSRLPVDAAYDLNPRSQVALSRVSGTIWAGT